MLRSAKQRNSGGGGVVGIPKDFVGKIRETAKMPAKEDGPEKKTGSEKKNRDEVIDFEYYKEKKLLLKAKLDQALERFLHFTYPPSS